MTLDECHLFLLTVSLKAAIKLQSPAGETMQRPICDLDDLDKSLTALDSTESRSGDHNVAATRACRRISGREEGR